MEEGSGVRLTRLGKGSLLPLNLLGLALCNYIFRRNAREKRRSRRGQAHGSFLERFS